MSVKPDYIHDTIVAPATAPGKGGISVVRISGPLTEFVAGKMLGKLPVPRYATATTFMDENSQPIDSGLALYFPAPNSFTGESVLELQGHGGPVIVALIVDAVTRLGARRAEPGEFSKRAFLNDKLDLVQAEAIADLIDSGTIQAARAAHRSLTGTFSRAVHSLSERLIQIRLYVEAAIDFPEEEIDFLSDQGLQTQLQDCKLEFQSLLEQAGSGRALRDGLRFVIVGKPNVGKSSLLNCLSGQDAAIVTAIEGTTRDIIREQIDIDGLSVELVDTAGLRNYPGAIEAEGIRRARQAMSNADAVLWIQDASKEDSEEDTEKDDDRPRRDIPGSANTVIVRNKIDLTSLTPGVAQIDPPVVHVSAKTGAGLDALRQLIAKIAGYEDFGEGAFTARRRHVQALAESQAHFLAGHKALTDTRAGEILAEELRLAHSSLSEITGEFSSDDLLGRVFAEFCIGK